ncbi:AAA family ATPase [Kitasatospora sp. NPDC001527]|uniref:AAA family ATPase n=1 Tax=Kitasatospora sp. NPDC001527 TaxID=3154519 RepID=UPI00332228BA
MHKLLLVGPTGSGKTHRLQHLAAAYAADPTAVIWAIDPHTQLVGADRRTGHDGAAQMLADALALVDARAARSDEHTPTEAEPRVLLLIDEADELMAQQKPTVEQLLRLVATGRRFAVGTALAVRDTTLQTWQWADLRDHYLSPDTAEHLPRRHSGEED